MVYLHTWLMNWSKTASEKKRLKNVNLLNIIALLEQHTKKKVYCFLAFRT